MSHPSIGRWKPLPHGERISPPGSDFRARIDHQGQDRARVTVTDPKSVNDRTRDWPNRKGGTPVAFVKGRPSGAIVETVAQVWNQLVSEIHQHGLDVKSTKFFIKVDQRNPRLKLQASVNGHTVEHVAPLAHDTGFARLALANEDLWTAAARLLASQVLTEAAGTQFTLPGYAEDLKLWMSRR